MKKKKHGNVWGCLQNPRINKTKQNGTRTDLLYNECEIDRNG